MHEPLNENSLVQRCFHALHSGAVVVGRETEVDRAMSHKLHNGEILWCHGMFDVDTSRSTDISEDNMKEYLTEECDEIDIVWEWEGRETPSEVEHVQ